MDTPTSMGSSTPVPSVISEYFEGKGIFITGATGFLGKALVEKLLRSCYNLDKIYLLMRAKKGKSPEERLDELTNCKVVNSKYLTSFLIFELITLIFN